MSDDDCGTMCASSVDVAHSVQKEEEETSGSSDIGSPLESYKVSVSSELDAEDEASKEKFEPLERSEGHDATDGV